MKQANLTVNRSFLHSQPVDERLYSAFMEHLGDVVYGGIYDPAHPSADANGFRRDVIELVKKLRLPMIRYPGGNYICSYNWEDTVGPVERRPRRLELAWQAIEPNTVGLPEFREWLKAVESELMMAINMGTRGLTDAVNLVEYCNVEGGTYWSDLRNQNGEAPYGIRLWCVGNEPDGVWQIARRRPGDYAWDAAETCKALKRIDPRLGLVVCGTSATSVETYGEWDRQVLMAAYDYCEYISIHHYLGGDDIDDPIGEYLASSRRMERQIETTIGVCDLVKGMKGSDKTIYISFDEYNVITKKHGEEVKGVPLRPQETLWKTGVPPTQGREFYNLQHTLLFGGALLSLLRYSDRVKIACQSILVGAGGLVRCEKDGGAWVNATYYPMLHVSTYGRGTVMQQAYDSPKYETEKYGAVDCVDTVSVWHEEGEVDVFAINRTDEPVHFVTRIEKSRALSPLEHILLTADSLDTANTPLQPDALAPVSVADMSVDSETVCCDLPPYSWNVLRIGTK